MELLAPCGSPDHLEEAIRSGADACYFGPSRFSARAHAQNFTLDEIRHGVVYAHQAGVSMHAAINTLVYNDELMVLTDLAAALGEIGVDACIVQDLGVAKMLRQGFPHMPLHASTQTLCRHPHALKVLKSLGFQRAVLARETPLDELQDFKAQDMEIEVFVHGAQCVSYSGACYFSAFHGGRSGNRGDCAQPCRMPYSLSTDGKPFLQGHLLSSKDMDVLELIPQLMAFGVDAIKIEGRMKSLAYLAVTCRSYRLAIDAVTNGIPMNSKDIALLKKDMASVFSRGGSFSQGYMRGVPGRENMYIKNPKNMGVSSGHVKETNDHGFLLSATDPLSLGDGFALYNKNHDLIASGYIHEMLTVCGKKVKVLEAGEEAWITTKGSALGGCVFYRTFHKALEKSLSQGPKRHEDNKRALAFYLEAHVGEPMTLTLMDDIFQTVSVSSQYLVESALKVETSPAAIEKQLSRLGDTPYRMEGFYPSLDSNIFIPTSFLNDLRRQAVASYQAAYGPESKEAVTTSVPASESKERVLAMLDRIPPQVTYPKETLISIDVSRYDQALAAMDVGCHSLMLNLTPYRRHPLFHDRDLKDIVKRAHRLNIDLGVTWSPIVDKRAYSAYVFTLERAEKLGIDLLGVKNLSYLPPAKERGFRLQAEPHLNITNDAAISSLVDLGFEGVLLSMEMTPQEMGALSYKGNIALGGHIFGDFPLMVSAYCPPGSLIGGKHTGSPCSGPCLANAYALSSPTGQSYPIVHDGFCRTEIYDERLRDGLPYLDLLHEANLDFWRLSFVRHDKEVVVKSLERLWTYLEGGPLQNLPYPTTDGCLFQGVKRTYA